MSETQEGVSDLPEADLEMELSVMRVVLVCLLAWLAGLFAVLAVNWLASFWARELGDSQSGAIAITVLSAAFTGLYWRRQEKVRPENGLAWVVAFLSAFVQAIVNVLIFAGLWLYLQSAVPVSDDPPGLFYRLYGIFVFLCFSVLLDTPLIRLGFWLGFIAAERRAAKV